MRSFLSLTLFIILLLPQVSAQHKWAPPPIDPTPSTANNTYHKVSHQLPLEYQADQVKDFVHSYLPALHSQGYDLSLTTETQSPGGKHFTFSQLYQGLPLDISQLKVNVTKQGKIFALTHNLYLKSPQVAGSFSQDSSLLLQQLSQELQPYQISVNAGYLAHDNNLIPIYTFKIYRHIYPHAEERLINAHDGKLISTRNLAVYHHEACMGDTTGRGVIFKPDPCTKAQKAYGVDFTDANDQDLPIFSSLMDTVILQGLVQSSNGQYRLIGEYVKLEDIDPLQNNVPVTTDLQFFYNRSDQEFEDVMCYYHIDTYQRYVRQLGFTSLFNNPLRVDAHGFGNSDNSHFVPNGGGSYLGFGDGGVDDAEDADVILHEYGHALSYYGSPGTNNGTQRRGLDEGYGDYIAAGYSYDLDTTFWADIFTWDGHNPFWPGRSAKFGSPFSGQNNIYDVGQIWASAGMQIRLSIGAHKADKLMLQTLYNLSSNLTMEDAGNLLLDNDTIFYNGIHRNQIVSAMCNYDIFTGAICNTVIGLDPRQEVNIECYPNPTDHQLNLNWAVQAFKGNLDLRLMDTQGREVYQEQAPNSGQLKMQLDLPSGLYLLQLKDSKGTHAHYKIQLY